MENVLKTSSDEITGLVVAPVVIIRVTDTNFAVPPINPNFDPGVVRCYMGEYIAIAADGNNFFFAWGDNRNTLVTPNFPGGRPDPDVFFEKEEFAQQELSLTEILAGLGFANIQERPRRQTFPAGTYSLQLLAEFSAFHAENTISRYRVRTSSFIALISGPEGNFGFTDPPVVKEFTSPFRFGLALDSPTGQWFTQDRRNIDGVRHVTIFRDLDNPGSFLIGSNAFLPILRIRTIRISCCS